MREIDQALFDAISQGRPERIGPLIAEGANSNAYHERLYDEWRPMHHAALDAKRAIDVFLTLLEQSDLPPVARVLLYGSHARGENHADSDIDIAVVLKGDSPPRSERGVFRRKLSCLRSDAMLETLQPLSAMLLWESMLDEPDNVISSGFYHNVLTDGVVLTLH